MGERSASSAAAIQAIAALPPPPRAVRIRWSSLWGPNFPYFLHVAIFSLIPLIAAAWLAFNVAWIVCGRNVDGRFVYMMDMGGPGDSPHDQMWVEFRVDNIAMQRPAAADNGDLFALGMPERLQVTPGKPVFTANIPVHVLRVGSEYIAEPIFPRTSFWKRLILPSIVFIATLIGMLVLHGELYRIIPLDRRLLRHGIALRGKLLGTHETGWWEASGDYGWTYIRRIYADYSFIDPNTHRERRGCQLVLGELDPAELPEDYELTVLYEPGDPIQHTVYEFSPFRARTSLLTSADH